MLEFLASAVNKLVATLSAVIIAVTSLVLPASDVTTVSPPKERTQEIAVISSNLDQPGSSVNDESGTDDLKIELEALRGEIAELKNGNGQQVKEVATKPQVIVKAPSSEKQTLSSIEVDFIDPAIVINSNDHRVEIHGSGFKKGLTVSTGDSYLELAMNFNPNPQPNVIFIKLPAGMNPGIYSIKVKNLDGGTATLDRALTVRASSATQDSGLSTIEIANRLRQVVVLIRTDTSCGSGILIDRSEILTNNHVVKNVSSARVLLNGGQILSATVVARGSSNGLDLALLRLVSDYKLPFITFSASDEQSLPIGSEVVALGYPLTCNEDFTFIAEEGGITGRRSGWLQTSARIHGGNSGGPLISKKTGQVVGINTLGIFVVDGFNLSGISFALPSDDVRAWLIDIRSR